MTITATNVNREQLISDYADIVIDNMTVEDMQSMLYDFMTEDFDRLPTEQLISEVQEVYPDLLQD